MALPPQFIKKKKKKLSPFHAKVAGKNARSRPDRKAYRRGGAVAGKADADLLSPATPKAPKGGRVVQKSKYQEGGAVPPGFRYGTDPDKALIRTRRQMETPKERPALPTPTERPALPNVTLERPSIKDIELKYEPKEVGAPQRKRGGVAKRQYGGRTPRPGLGPLGRPDTYPGGAGGPRVGEDIARRTEEGMRPKTEEGFLKGRDEIMPRNYQEGGGISSVRRKPKPGESREPPPLTGPVEGLKDGGDSGKWIGKARASMERRGTVGSLRKAMGTKSGETIPTSSLQAKKAQAKRTGNTKMMRKVQFALNVR